MIFEVLFVGDSLFCSAEEGENFEPDRGLEVDYEVVLFLLQFFSEFKQSFITPVLQYDKFCQVRVVLEQFSRRFCCEVVYFRVREKSFYAAIGFGCVHNIAYCTLSYYEYFFRKVVVHVLYYIQSAKFC